LLTVRKTPFILTDHSFRSSITSRQCEHSRVVNIALLQLLQLLQSVLQYFSAGILQYCEAILFDIEYTSDHEDPD